MQRRVYVLWMRQAPVLLRMATAPKTFMRNAEVEDQAPAARLVLGVVADLRVAAPLPCACRYAVLRADRVSGRANNGPSAPTIQSFALVLVERHGIVTV